MGRKEKMRSSPSSEHVTYFWSDGEKSMPCTPSECARKSSRAVREDSQYLTLPSESPVNMYVPERLKRMTWRGLDGGRREGRVDRTMRGGGHQPGGCTRAHARAHLNRRILRRQHALKRQRARRPHRNVAHGRRRENTRLRGGGRREESRARA